MQVDEEKRLLKQLRSRHSEKRWKAAKGLVNFSTEKSVNALSRMANGQRRTLFFNYTPEDQFVAIEYLQKAGKIKEAVEALKGLVNSTRFTLDEQLKAIEYLGKSGEPSVLDFLQRLYTSKVSIETKSESTWYGDAPVWDDWTAECYSYPNAIGPLSLALSYEVSLTFSNNGRRSESDIENDRKRSRDSRAHQIILNTINKLRGADR